MTEPGRAEVEGTLDLTDKYGRLGDRDENGETVGGTTTDDRGEEATITWPSEVDPDELTDQQRQAFELALANPTQTCDSIDEEIGTQSYSNKMFRRKAPEWYENVFKPTGTRKPPSTTSEESEENANTTSTEETPETDLEQVLTVCHYLSRKDTPEGELAEWVVKKLA